MTTLNIHQLKARFSYYTKQVLKGESFIIALRNRPFAILQPLQQGLKPKALRFGVVRGKFRVPADFNAPLADFEKSFYGT